MGKRVNPPEKKTKKINVEYYTGDFPVFDRISILGVFKG